MLSLDLHTHSTASDGTLSPSDLVRLARSAKLRVLALTDHDTTAGLEEARQAAAAAGIQLVAGVEISVTWQGRTVHVLGLGVDPHSRVLQQGLRNLQVFRAWRAAEIGRRLDKQGIKGTYTQAATLARAQLIGRVHFARVLVQRGLAPDQRAVFRHFMIRGKPGYVPGQWAPLEDAVSWIRAAGGRAVLAHPARYRLTRTKLRRLLSDFVAAGGEGLEVVCASHSRDDCFVMARHARDFALLASLGSDYHGPDSPWAALGRLPALPPGCVPIWHDWQALFEGLALRA
jgi:predicted metal-dependent phosphoesterase TrpH